MVCITRDALNSREYRDLVEAKSPLSKSDIATIVEMMSKVVESTSSEYIQGIYTDNKGHFVALVGNKGNFDLYKYLNENYKEDVCINCVNAKVMFPISMSNGEYFHNSLADEDETSNMEETSTGYMDEEDLREIIGNSSYYLEYVKDGRRISISSNPTYIGRSSNDADFVIRNNNNITRRHCSIWLIDGKIILKDENSLNGTYVNNYRLEKNEEKSVEVGDTIYVADEKFIVKR